MRSVAHLDQHRAQPHHALAGLRHAQYAARHRRAHLKRTACGTARALHHVQRGTGLGQVGTRHLLVLPGQVHVLARHLHRQAFCVEPRGGHKALLCQLLRAAQVALGLRQHGAAALAAHGGALHTGLRGSHARLLLTQAAFVQQRGQGRLNARHHVPGLHCVALAQGHAFEPPCQRCRDGIAVAQAGAGIFINACLEAPLHHGGHLHLLRPRGKGPGQQRAQQQHCPRAHPHRLFLHCQVPALLIQPHSRVLSAPTMSSRSICRRTTSALARPAATTHSPATA